MKKQAVLLLATAVMAGFSSVSWAYLATPVTLSGWVKGEGTFNAKAIYYPGSPLDNYREYSGDYSETGSNSWTGAGGSYTTSRTSNNLSTENFSRTSGNAFMKGRGQDGLWTGQAYISSTKLDVSVLDFNPARTPPGYMIGQAEIYSSTYFSGYRWNAEDSATARMTGTVAGATPSSNATLLIGPGGDLENGDQVTMEIIFQSGELGYDSWDLKIGGNVNSPLYHFLGGSDSSEYFRRETTLTVGTSYFFSYQTVQNYTITTIGSGGQADNYSCGLELNVIPEPATIGLLGLGGIILRGRKS